jgi:hypothetical protein
LGATRDWPALPPSAQGFALGDALVVLWAVAVLYLALFVVWTVLRLVRRSYSRCQLARPRGGMLKRRPRRSHGWLTARLLRRRV